ncbi:MAG: hypothetical protein IPO41_09320 [Acidobacteria bacterium]|nr:hypothetical protein [Acidobacteriota bacterium]
MSIKDSMRRNSLLTILLITTLLLPGLNLAVRAQTPQRKPTQAGAPFPRTHKLSTGGAVTIFEPQIASWEKQTELVAWSAVSYEAKPGDKPSIGSIKIEADTEVSLDERLVRFKDFKIPEVNLSSLSRDDARKVTTALQAELPEGDKIIDLDKVLAAVDKSQLLPKADNPAGLKADPPTVFYSSKPAVLVGFDGDPIWSPIKDSELKYAVNTNWDIFEQPATKIFYLRKDENWFKSTDLSTGWVPAGKLPDSFSKLPADDNWKEVKANVPGKSITADKMPKIVVTTTPSELIVTTGAPKYTPVTGTSLLWVNNTEADVFRNGAAGLFYYLVAGRWFSGPSLDGPWTFATPDLPGDFKSIPVEHPRSRVLASIPGTDQATEAVLQATIPTTATVDRTQLKAPEVIYQGEPEFQPIKDTALWQAVNTDKQIIKFGEQYYMCYQAVWFLAQTPKGPWTVASEIPAEIYKIPASSPVHNVTYVTITASSPTYVSYRYYPAYTGMMVAWGCAVWGTGWYYRPYVWYAGFYPIYYPYYRTYGYAAWYNPYIGVYGRGALAYGPYGGVGFGAIYNPRTGVYARGVTAYGPYGSRTFAQAYNPRTGTYAQTRQGSNIYGNWGSSYVQRGDSWAQTGRASSNITGNSVAGVRTSSGAAAVTGKGQNGRTTVAKSNSGDIYAGHNGNVYKKTGDGWSSVGGANASPTGTQKGLGGIDSSTYNQLNRDSRARSEGAMRTQTYNNYRSSMGGRTTAGSYRGGGFSRGGRRR